MQKRCVDVLLRGCQDKNLQLSIPDVHKQSLTTVLEWVRSPQLSDHQAGITDVSLASQETALPHGDAKHDVKLQSGYTSIKFLPHLSAFPKLFKKLHVGDLFLAGPQVDGHHQ